MAEHRRSTRDVIREVDHTSPAQTGRLRMIGFPHIRAAPSIDTFDLQLRRHRNALALTILSEQKATRNIGAAYDSDLNLIPDTQRARQEGHNWEPSPTTAVMPAEVRRLPGRTFFAGTHARHFGHILLETLPRFWPKVGYGRYDHFLTIPSHGSGEIGENNPMMHKLLKAARIDPDKLVVATLGTPVQCDLLEVASPAFLFGRVADPRFLTIFDRMGARYERRRYGSDLSALPAKIYLSRSRLATNTREKRSADNEPEVEAFMAGHGFEVIHPQERPFHEQIALARRAEVIAGCDGSALHLAVFARPGTKMLALDTRREPNQLLIDQARGLDSIHLWAATEEVENRLATWTVDMERLAAALDLLMAG